MTHETQNDLRKVKLMMEMFNQIKRLSFQTEKGQSFKRVMTETIDGAILTYARETYTAIKGNDNVAKTE